MAARGGTSSRVDSSRTWRTPFGELFATVKRESDEKVPGSLRASLGAVAETLGLPEVVTR